MTKEEKQQMEVKDDDYAEVPEEVLDEEELQELKEMEEENGKEDKKLSRAEREKLEAEKSWEPKTKLGQKVKNGEIKDIDEILESYKILEEQIVDTLIPVQSDLVAIGQSKGKFGGGKRRAWRQTQRKTKEGNVPTFSAMAIIGDENGHVGLGEGRAKETLPARDKAIRKAKLNLIKVKRTCAAFDCKCDEKHTIPFEVEGKSGSVTVRLMPAPQGTGLVVADNLKALLRIAGVKDVYSKTFGKNRTTFNLVKACFKALEKTNE